MSRKSVALIVLVLTSLSMLVVGFARSKAISSKPKNLTETIEVEQRSDSRLEAELLVIRSEGFHPTEITRPRGPFLLALQNHSGSEELSLVLLRDAGASVKQIPFQKKQSKVREVLDLPPGRYLLVESNHPNWTCTITITPH